MSDVSSIISTDDPSVARPLVAVVVNDLLFGTKIRSTATSLGVDIELLRSAADLRRLLDGPFGVRVGSVIVDLNTANEAVACIREGKTHGFRPRIIAYVAHVDEELARQAREAGADEVMPRSRFSAQLPTLLSRGLQPARGRLPEKDRAG